VSTEYRIDFTITRRREGEDDFTEIGFGSSGAWGDPAQAAHILESSVEHFEWETSTGMPDPDSVRADLDDL
jgi:hypothetical protein